MAGRKHPDGVAGYLKSLNIVPVYISYELDPCDKAAVELWKTEADGEYQKADSEDLENILLGIKGQKGNVKVAFGQPIQNESELESPEALASAIDAQMKTLYQPWETNQVAAACQGSAESAKLTTPIACPNSREAACWRPMPRLN